MALGYSLILNQMYLSDWLGDLYTVNLATGERTFVGTINSPISDGFRIPNRGLAFVEISTAAPGTISGQIVSRSGEPIHKATVTARDQNGAVYTAISDKRGRFRIVDVPTGETYTISASAKRYSFPPTLITLNEDLTGLTLTATR